jgi:HicB family
MITTSLGLSESLHRRAKELARQEGIAINQLVATALAEKISALAAGEYLESRVARGSRRKFDRALRKVACSPKADPFVMRVWQALDGPRTLLIVRKSAPL